MRLLKGKESATLWDQASATLWGQASATLWDQASATLGDQASATLRDHASATLRDHASATLGPCAVAWLRSPHATAKGGTVITPPATAEEWVQRAGLDVVDGTVTLFKAVDDDFVSSRGFKYQPGTTPEAHDFDAEIECGAGLHFAASPTECLSFHRGPRFVGCPVAVGEIVVHQWGRFPWKVKAPRCAGPVWECDKDGNPVEEK